MHHAINNYSHLCMLLTKIHGQSKWLLYFSKNYKIFQPAIILLFEIQNLWTIIQIILLKKVYTKHFEYHCNFALYHGAIWFSKLGKICQTENLLQALQSCVSEYLQVWNVGNAMIYLFSDSMHNFVELFQEITVKWQGVFML